MGTESGKRVDICICMPDSLLPYSRNEHNIVNVHSESLQLCPPLCNPWTVAHQAPLSTDSPGKNTEVGCSTILKESSQPRIRTHVSCVSCITGGFYTPIKIKNNNNNNKPL